MLSDLQKARILFHLDLPSQMNDLLSVDREILITQVSATLELQLVGNLASADPENIYVYEGTPLATLESILGRVERAYDKLSPTTIDDSLFVKKAGAVELTSTEIRQRRKLYLTLVEYLAQTLGALSLGGSRVGF